MAHDLSGAAARRRERVDVEGRSVGRQHASRAGWHRPSSANVAFLIPMSSNTASTTMSTLRIRRRSCVGVMSAIVRSTASGVILPLETDDS